jgi:hypothetical protein
VNSGPHGAWFATTPDFWAQVRLPIVGWKLWYADGLTVTSQDVPWADAPRQGVEVLMVYHPNGYRTIVKGRDEYTFPGEAESKLGLEIDRGVFEAMQRAAMADSWRL